jgi:hypothetical protein
VWGRGVFDRVFKEDEFCVHGRSRRQRNLFIDAVRIHHLLTVCNTCCVTNLCSYAEMLFEVPHVLHLPRTCC